MLLSRQGEGLHEGGIRLVQALAFHGGHTLMNQGMDVVFSLTLMLMRRVVTWI